MKDDEEYQGPPDDDDTPSPKKGQIEKRGVSVEIERSAETGTAALAEAARARVEAGFVVARRFPRDIEQVRVRLLAACKRPGFAATAEYVKPIGNVKNKVTGAYEPGFAKGPSIRMIEQALQLFGNFHTESPVVFDDENARHINTMITDLETNATFVVTAVIEKTVERSRAGKRKALGTRSNSFGDAVYVLRATEAEMTLKEGVQKSIALRNCGCKIIPRDILDDAILACRKTCAAEDKNDPTAARRRVFDAYAEVGVMPPDLVAYLGHPLDTATPDELEELRGLYAAIRDGEATWHSIVDAKNGGTSDESKAASTVVRGAKERAKTKAKAAAGAKKPPEASPRPEEPPQERQREPGED